MAVATDEKTSGFEAVVAEAAALCPFSRLFGGTEITVGGHLLQGRA